MPSGPGASNPDSFRGSLLVLHPVFALTGVVHAIGGPLLPSLSSKFHLTDGQAGFLLALYFAGSSVGALMCRTRYARTMALGFVAILICCLAVTVVAWPLLLSAFLLLGVSVGLPMSAVSLYAGRAFPHRRAPVLTLLNFSWSAGALVAPLLAARVLADHDYRFAYLLLAVPAVLAAWACFALLREPEEPARPAIAASGSENLRIIFLFALAAFLQVGVENTSAAWLSTFTLRMASRGVVLAAASSSLYWAGFLGTRGLASFVLLKANPKRLLQTALASGVIAGALLIGAPSAAARDAAMFMLGASLGPVYPLVIAGSLAGLRETSDTRWVLFAAGFGGSVLPWLAGSISVHTGSLRGGMLTIPVTLLVMAILFRARPDLERRRPQGRQL